MSLVDSNTIHPDALELAELMRPSWPAIDAALHLSGVPLCEGEAGGEGAGGEGGAGSGDEGGEGGGEGAGASGDPKDGKFDADYVKGLRGENAATRKKLRDTEAKLKKLEEQGLSEADKLKKDAEEGTKRGETGTQKLRTANVILGLADHGLTGGRAKAAAKLLDTVEFDDDDEPTNLEAALKAAAKVYGDDVFAAGGERPRGPHVPRGPQGLGGGSSSDMDAAIRRAAGRR
jgi:hypothetical protein